MDDRNLHNSRVSAAPSCQRRMVLGAGVALLPILTSVARADDAPPDPTELRPQVGDHLVFLTGPKQGQPVHVNDLTLGGPQEQVYPADPNGTVRDGSPLNLVIVVRVGNEGLSEDAQSRVADGVLAFSGVCTHQACPVNMWLPEKNALYCSCHGSTYDPKADAEVIAGPAPRHLPALPLKSDNGLLVVAGKFTSRVGGQTS